jgi:cell division protein FtsL
MSTLTHGQRSSGARTDRKPTAAAPANRRPYFVMNGATMVAVAAIALTVIGILYLIQTSEVAQLGYDMSRLQEQRNTLTMETSELEYELARYESLQTVEEVAVTRLGMTPMTNYEFLDLDAPAQRNLVIPEQASSESPGIAQRLLDAVMGVGTVRSEQADMSEFTLGESRR